MSQQLSDAQLEADLAFAIQTAREAGERIAGLRETGRWTDPVIMGDVADQAADGYLQGYLRGRYPDDGILSEETADSEARLACWRTWIVDPLDGTKEYRTDRDDYAVHVAMTLDGVPAVGAVALPALGSVLWGVSLPGRERGGIEGSDAELLRGDSPEPDTHRMVCSRSHTPAWIERFVEALGDTELVRCGSVGFKASRLLLGEADLYVHKTGLKEWDTCAPEVIARALGWHVCRIDGSAQVYNQADPRNDELIICRPAIAERVLETVQRPGIIDG
ncbi:3'(2'),5'-bisphosphate nucleotidase CysQ [Engelhardtia mirabilis]|uniref:3'(2'),5-bisphosphonucleoside 3'(2')-phosphohydrolase n=1 Tax=Engelhardtia mirabilis TaxID=2528011 RepID=A0A518BG06_9BACT|nr:3'-phosphoadenosine 5'-phosphate phosphatase [Planctomycetes bacterium Pla133]QDV00169.1 3'-phosphoadenosine 5'-phosphate phosphatase [Planctomycetes bacterium Pla86]